MAEKISVLISEEEIDARVREMAAKISADYAGKQIHVICVLRGSVFFMCELAKRLTVPVDFDFMAVSSYGSSTVSSGIVRIVKDLDEPLEGRNVLVVEDIVDSGRTLCYLKELMMGRGAASVRFCTLLDKPSRRVTEFVPDYTGFQIPDKYVVGYGMDIDQRYRNLPYVGVVETE